MMKLLFREATGAAGHDVAIYSGSGRSCKENRGIYQLIVSFAFRWFCSCLCPNK